MILLYVFEVMYFRFLRFVIIIGVIFFVGGVMRLIEILLCKWKYFFEWLKFLYLNFGFRISGGNFRLVLRFLKVNFGSSLLVLGIL